MPEFKQALLEETGGEREAFIERAVRTLDDCVCNYRGHARTAKPTLIEQLHRWGYPHQEILRALAVAWYEDTATFSLPHQSCWRFFQSGWFLFGLPVLIALVSLILSIPLLMKHYPEQMGVFARLPPLLAMIGFVIAAVLHLLFKGVAAVLAGLGAADEQDSPSATRVITCDDPTPQPAHSLQAAAPPSPQPNIKSAPTLQVVPTPQPEEPMYIYADGISQITLSNNNLRIQLVQNGPDDSALDAGTLILPVTQAPKIINNLSKSLKQLDDQLKAQKDAITH